jgi:hypothetical protein
MRALISWHNYLLKIPISKYYHFEIRVSTHSF